MLRLALWTIHIVELLLYTWLLYDAGSDGPFDWLVEVLGMALAVRFVIITLTFVIARTPLHPVSLALSVLAAEYFAAVYVFSYAALRRARSLIPPSRAAVQPDPLPIIFVHGFSCNAGFWRRYLARFDNDWGAYLATIDLEPVHGLIDDYARAINQRIDELLAVSGQDQCLIVAHSMGGLATRHLLRDADARARVAGVVTLGTPHGGTRLAEWSFALNARQMRLLSEWLDRLRDDEQHYTLPPFEALVGTHDNIVAPQDGAAFDQATNTYMHGVSHLAMALNENVIDWTLARCARLSHQHAESQRGPEQAD